MTVMTRRGQRFLCAAILLVGVAAVASLVFAQDHQGADQRPSSELQAGGANEQLPPPPPPSPEASALADASSAAEKNAAIAAAKKAEEKIPPLSEKEITEGIKVNKDKISLDLKGIDINELFRILSFKMGVTIVASKNVTGRINVFLNNVTLQDALDIILVSQDLASDRKGNVINIMTSAEYERLYGKKYNEKRKFKNIKLTYAKPSTVFNALGQLKSDIGKIIVDEGSGNIFLIDIPEKIDLMTETVKALDRPLQTEVFDIKYAKSADIKAHLSSAITAGAGELYVDEKSSRVVISDFPEKMKKIKKVISAFDAEPLEVFIEAEIIQITLNNQFSRGINWERILSESNMKKLGLLNKKSGINANLIDIAGSFLPGAPVTSTAFQKIVFGTMATDNFTVVLQYLQTYGDTKILSRPRIAAVNNQEAKILVGRRDAYVSQTLSQAQTTTVTSESVQFIDVGVKLNVVPTISRDGFVTMKIKPEISSVAETITTSLGSRIPIVETAESETVIKVKDGTTIMIAGLMKDTKIDNTNGIPGLSKIPFVGAAFGSKATQTQRSEIVVFLTPHVITGDATMPGTGQEKFISPDMVTNEIRDNVVARSVDAIDTKEFIEKEDTMKAVKSAIGSSGDIAAIKTSETKSDIGIQGKMKGLKGL